MVFAQPLCTRQQRVDHATARLAAQAKLPTKARGGRGLLQSTSPSESAASSSMDILKVDPLPKLGTPMEIVAQFGGKAGYLAALSQLKNELYRPAPATNAESGSPCRTYRTSSRPSRHHAQRRRNVWRCAATRAAWLDVFLKIFDDREKELRFCATTTDRRCRSTCAGLTGP